MLSLRRFARLSAVTALGGVAAVALLGVTSPLRGEVGPGTVEIRAGWAWHARTSLGLPPFGSVSAPTHRSPLELEARVERIDLEAVRDLATDSDADAALQQQVEDDLSGLLRRFAIRSAIIAALVGAVAGAVIPRRRWSSVAVGAVGGVVAVMGLLTLSWWTYQPEAFDEPRFEGPIERAPELIATARRYVEDFEAVRDRISVLGAQLSDLYATSTTEAIAAGPGDRRILHVSDVHLNPVGLEIVRDLAEQFDVDAILDTGDLTTFGSPLEASFGELLEDMPAPYLVVPGNHDSGFNRRALDDVGGVRMLDGDSTRVAGIEVLGMGHPAFTAANDLTPEDVTDALATQAIETRTLVRRLNPDVLAVHDARQARVVLGEVPLVVAGHVHETTVTETAGTIVLTVGSTGATGLGSFTVETDLAYEAEVLHLSDSKLVAVDSIAFQGTGGEFRIDRRLFEPED